MEFENKNYTVGVTVTITGTYSDDTTRDERRATEYITEAFLTEVEYETESRIDMESNVDLTDNGDSFTGNCTCTQIYELEILDVPSERVAEAKARKEVSDWFYNLDCETDFEVDIAIDSIMESGGGLR